MLLRRVLWFVAFGLLYEWFVVTGTRDEAIAACCIALVGTGLSGYVVRRGRRLAPVALSGWVALITRIPFAICRETVDVLGPVLWRAIVDGERRPGRWIALRYNRDPLAKDGTARDGFARRTMIVFGSGLTPNACPLAIDEDARLLSLHQLVHRRESAASDPEFPI